MKLFRFKKRTIKKPELTKIVAICFTIVMLIYVPLTLKYMIDTPSALISPLGDYEDVMGHWYEYVVDASESEGGVLPQNAIDELQRRTVALAVEFPLEIYYDGELIARTDNRYAGLISDWDSGTITWMDYDPQIADKLKVITDYSDKNFTFGLLSYKWYYSVIKSAYINFDTFEFYPGVVEIHKINPFTYETQKVVEVIDFTVDDPSFYDGFTYVNATDGMYVHAFYVNGDIENVRTYDRYWDYGSGPHSFKVVYDCSAADRAAKATLIIWIIISVIIVITLTAVSSAIVYIRAKSTYNIFEYRRKTTIAMAHDLKTPLAIASVYVDNLRESIDKDPAKTMEHADKIEESVTYLNKLIGNILEFSNSEESAGKISKEKFDVRAEIESYIKSIESACAARSITIRLTGNTMRNTDKDIWNQAVFNLIDNAVKYSVGSEEIDILMDDKEITIVNKVNSDIKDTSKLLEPFVKGDENRGENSGSGLGLAIADNNLRKLGYKLTVKCENKKFSATIK